MRISSFATLLGLSFVACTVGDNPGGGDDDTPPPGCGNGQMDPGEQCDDGNNASGDGCSASCQMEAAPRLDLSVDKANVATELHTTQMLTITLTASEGFQGDVTLAPSVVDAANAPIAGWTVALDKTLVSVPLNGTASVVATLTVPSDSTVLSGSVKVAATSTVPRVTGAMTATSAITAQNQITFGVKLDANGQCILPTPATIPVHIGTMVRFVNNDPNRSITIHMQDNAGTSGLKHEPDPGMPANVGVYAQVAGGANKTTGTSDWYCHDPQMQNPNNRLIQVIQ